MNIHLRKTTPPPPTLKLPNDPAKQFRNPKTELPVRIRQRDTQTMLVVFCAMTIITHSEWHTSHVTHPALLVANGVASSMDSLARYEFHRHHFWCAAPRHSGWLHRRHLDNTSRCITVKAGKKTWRTTRLKCNPLNRMQGVWNGVWGFISESAQRGTLRYGVCLSDWVSKRVRDGFWECQRTSV